MRSVRELPCLMRTRPVSGGGHYSQWGSFFRKKNREDLRAPSIRMPANARRLVITSWLGAYDLADRGALPPSNESHQLRRLVRSLC